MKGKLIVLEGLDGCGKTTQGALLKEELIKKGYRVLLTREPGGTEISERLRAVILDKTIENMHPFTELYLYGASRCQLVHQVIIPALEEGSMVILDRFLLSSVAYQGYGRQLGANVVKDINALAVDGVQPDLTVLFDMKKDDSRISEDKDRMELSSREFFDRVYEGYMQEYDREATLVVDAKNSIEAIHKKIMERVEAVING